MQEPHNIKKTCQTICPYCGVGCGVIITKEGDKFSVTGNSSHPANYGRLCSKGNTLGDTLDLADRLKNPQIDGQTANWDSAITIVADTFTQTLKKHGKDSVAFYVSGQLLTEDYYIANKLMKGYFGSANIDTNSRLCMSSAVVGYKRAFGADTVPVSYKDVEGADCLIFVGSNAAWTHPVLYQRVVAAKAKNPNLTIIVIDPRKTVTAEIADIFLAINPATDGYLFNGLLHYLDANQHLDLAFLADVDGVLTALNAVKKNYDIASVADICGLNKAEILSLYQAFANTPKTVILYSQGINQSSSGVDKVNSIINCFLATGRIGKANQGPFSLTGQPNAMGGREVGGLANQLTAHMDFDAADTDRVKRFWQSPTIATKEGIKATELVDAINSGQIKALWIMATNPVFSLPDSNKVRAALKKCPFVVVSECTAKTATTKYANVLLPASTWGENEGMVTNSERRISKRNKFLKTPFAAKDDWKIVQLVAQKMGFSGFDYANVQDIFNEYTHLTAFENNGSRDLDLQNLTDLSPAEYQNFSPQRWGQDLFKKQKFFTANGKAFMPAITAKSAKLSTSNQYPFLLNTGRTRDQWHTMTRTGKAAKLGQHQAEPLLSIHPTIAQQKGFKDKYLVNIISQYGASIVRLKYNKNEKNNTVFFPFHWTDNNSSHAMINALVNPNIDPLSGQPEFKQTPINITHFKAKWYGYLLSHQQLNNIDTLYQIESKGEGFYRYELAGDSVLNTPIKWIKSILKKDTNKGDWLSFIDKTQGRYRFALVHNNKLLACLFLSDKPNMPEPTWIGQLFKNPLSALQRQDILAGKPSEKGADKGRIICSCFNKGINEISALITSGDAITIEQIGEKIEAGSDCGSCIPELKQLIKTCLQ